MVTSSVVTPLYGSDPNTNSVLLHNVAICIGVFPSLHVVCGSFSWLLYFNCRGRTFCVESSPDMLLLFTATNNKNNKDYLYPYGKC